jgi:hypothetical protein
MSSKPDGNQGCKKPPTYLELACERQSLIAGNVSWMPPVVHKGAIDIDCFTAKKCVESADPQIVQYGMTSGKGQNFLTDSAAKSHGATKIPTMDQILENAGTKAA